jgi:glycosyltransferase involved in cell wall biosynthesis
MSSTTEKFSPDESGKELAVSLTVAMPVYNEQDAIVLATADVQRSILDHVSSAELVIVNDGSKDQSGRLADELAAKDSRIRVIHQENRGHGAALMTALSAARGDYIMLIDSDRQISLDSFSSAWVVIQNGRDGVFGVRRHRHDPVVRLWLTRVVRLSIRCLFGVRIFDANAPYKLLRRAIWIEAQRFIPPDTLAPSLLLAIFAKLGSYDIAEIEVFHRERTTGQASIRHIKLLKFSTKAFFQLIAFWWCMRHVR